MEIEDQQGRSLSVLHKLNGHSVETCIQTERYPYDGVRVAYNDEAETINILGRFDNGFTAGEITMNVVDFFTHLEVKPSLLALSATQIFEQIDNRKAVLDAADTVAQLRLEGRTDGMDEALDSLLDAVLKNR